MMKKFVSIGDQILKKAREQSDDVGGSRSCFKVPSDVPFLKPSKKILMDVIPFKVSTSKNPDHIKKGDFWYRLSYKVHARIGPQEQMVVCPTTFNLPCPICQEYRLLRQNPEASEDEIKALRPKERTIMNVVDLNDLDSGIQLFDMSNFLFHDMLKQEITLNEDVAVHNFTDIPGGRSLRCVFTEESFNGRKFLKIHRIDFVKRKEDWDDSILEQAVDLDKAVVVLDYDSLKKLYEEIGRAHV